MLTKSLPKQNEYSASSAANRLLYTAAERVRLARHARRHYEQHEYTPHGTAARLQSDTSSEILLSGPAGTGKSRACLEKLNDLAWQHRGMRGLIVRKTRTSLNESGLQTFEDYVLVGSPIVEGPKRPYRQAYEYPNGSKIVIGGMDKASRIMSTEFDVIFVQEATELDEDDWESLTTRLRNYELPYQQLIADCNPSYPKHWLKVRCDEGRTVMYESRHIDNPVLYNHEAGEWTSIGRDYIGKLDNLTGVRKDRLRYGKWVAAEGAIYDEFDRSVHLIDQFDIPNDWRRIRVIDFGYVNPFVCQWWAIDHDGRMYLYREIYMTGRLVEDHARQIKEASEGEQIEATIADHDAEDMATLERHGIRAQRAKKTVSAGIQAVKERLQPAGDGRSRLFIMRDSLFEVDQELVRNKLPFKTEQEFDSYIWNDKKQKDEPVKEHDHGMDTMRYAVMYLHIDSTVEMTDNPFFY